MKIEYEYITLATLADVCFLHSPRLIQMRSSTQLDLCEVYFSVQAMTSCQWHAVAGAVATILGDGFRLIYLDLEFRWT